MSKRETLRRALENLLGKYELADLKRTLSSLKKQKQPKNHGARKRGKKPNTTESKRRQPQSRAQISKRSSTLAKREKARPAAAAESLGSKNRTHKKKASKRAVDALDATRSLPVTKKSEVGYFISVDEKVNRESLARAVKAIKTTGGDDYEKWFRIISGDTPNTTPADLGTQSAESEEAAEGKSSKWGGEAIEHLRIRDLLLSGPFKLHGGSTNASRIVTFLPTGRIGKGRTQIEAAWRLADGKLELLDQAGEVQSRFALSEHGSFLQHVASEPTTKGQQLIRIAAKGSEVANAARSRLSKK